MLPHPLLAMFFFLYLLLLSISTGDSDLTADRAALLALRSAVEGRPLLWNTTQLSPCNWAGVQCENKRVTSLRLPANSLAGEVPTGTVGNLTSLRTLSLRFNGLSGGLPADLSSCTELRNLYLQGNQFSGELPGFLFALRDLVRLNVAGNKFAGKIPTRFNNLTRLKTLYLENNQFTGSITELKLPTLEQFNVSFNSLNGSVPASLKSMPASAFAGNSLCGVPLEICPRETVSPAIAGFDAHMNHKKKKRLSSGAIAGIVIGSALGFLLLLLVFFLCLKKRSKKTSAIDTTLKRLDPETHSGEKPLGDGGNAGVSNGVSVAAAAAVPMTAKEDSINGGAKKLVFFGNTPRVFDLEDLLRASAEVLGKGTFGTVYKAVLEMGTVVAVKRLKDVTVPEGEFREKIESVGAMDQENLVPLRAYYYSREEKLLVYDYMPMGSLSAFLHGNYFSAFDDQWKCIVLLCTITMKIACFHFIQVT